MGMRYLTGLLAALMLFSLPASGEPAELDAAIEAYLRDDFSQMDVVERYAGEGHPDALAVLGQACFYGLGCERDRVRGLDLLEQAADADDRPSAVQLGRIYENGSGGIEADASESARWYVKAAKAGDTLSAPPGLRRLPRDVVIDAGGERWLAKAPAAQAKAKAPQASPSGKPLPSLADTGLDPMDEEETATLEEEPQPSPSASPAPPPPSPKPAPRPSPVVMRDGTAFPLYADTGMSGLGDAAASCMADMDPEVERLRTRLEGLIQAARTASPAGSVSIKADMRVVTTELERLMIAYKAARDVLRTPALNGGYEESDIDVLYAAHLGGRDTRPEAGPGAPFCRDNFPTLMAEAAASRP